MYLNLLFHSLEPRLTTEENKAVVKDLLTCEKYLFAVGLVGPFGYGPLTTTLTTTTTLYYHRAPPRHLGVRSEKSPLNDTFMIVHWNAPCPSVNTSTTRYVVCYQDKVLC